MYYKLIYQNLYWVVLKKKLHPAINSFGTQCVKHSSGHMLGHAASEDDSINVISTMMTSFKYELYCEEF